jgi:hypothetical protein
MDFPEMEEYEEDEEEDEEVLALGNHQTTSDLMKITAERVE